MNYFPFHVGDYATHTAHLSDLEDLAYRRMLDAYYLHEKPLPQAVEAIARLIRMRPHIEAVQAVLDEFFDQEADGWHNTRADEELGKMIDKQAKASASAKLSHSNRTANAQRPQTERTATALLPTPTPTPTPIDVDKSTSKAPKVAPKARPSKRCPADFVVDFEMQAWAAENCPGMDWVRETENFRDWEFKTPRSDWPAGWRGWLRRAYDRDQAAGGRPAASAQHGPIV